MGYGEGERQPRVLADAAAPVRLTHAGHVGQTQRLARLVDGRADVLPEGRTDGKVSHSEQPAAPPPPQPNRLRRPPPPTDKHVGPLLSHA